MSEATTQKLLQDWVITNGRANISRGIGKEDLLMSTGILDSLGMMSLISYVEALLGREIPDELMSFDNFESIQKIQSVFFSTESRHEG